MPIKKNAMKALRQIRKRTVRNQAVKEGINYLRRATRKAMDAKELKQAEEFAKSTVKALDKAVQNKVLKLNTASRIKSRLMTKVNAMRNAKA